MAWEVFFFIICDLLKWIEMHIADEILKEVEERKIADIFSEPEKTKVFLQLKELEMIGISENGVEITEEGQKALDLGIKN